MEGLRQRVVGALCVLVFMVVVTACGARSSGTNNTGSSTSQSQTENQTQSPSGASKEQSEQAAGKPEPLAQPVKIKIAEDGSASGAGFYIADAKGYFQEMGIEIEFTTFSDSAAMLPAIATNQVQIGGGIVSVSMLNAVDRGINIKILGDKGHNVPGKSYFDIVVRKDLADMKSIEELRGKKVAIASKGSTNEYLLWRFLQGGKLTLDDVDVVEIPDFGQMITALSTGAVDASGNIEPLITQGESQGVLDRWIDLAEVYPEQQNAVMLASPQFVEDIEVSGRFMYAYLRALRDYNDAFFKGIGKDEIIRIMTEYTPLKDAELWQKTNVAGLDPNGGLYVDDLRAQTDYFKDGGYYQGNVDLASLIDLEPARYALEYLGEYE